MSNVWFPAFMSFLRRFAVLIAAMLALVIYIGVYHATQSVQLATTAVFIVLIFWIITLILFLRTLKR